MAQSIPSVLVALLGFTDLWCCLTGCAPAPPQAQGSRPVVVVPTPSTESVGNAAPPAATRAPPEPPDPLDYYVGTWRGLVNNTISTELTISPDGRFSVQAGGSAQQKPCDLSGRWRAQPNAVQLDVEHSSCQVESVGTTLTRTVVERSENAFELRSPDWTMRIEYTRLRKR